MANIVLFKNDITKIFIKMNKVGHEMQDGPIQVMEITYATPEFSRPHWMAACQTKILAETLRFKSHHKMACIVVCFDYNTRAYRTCLCEQFGFVFLPVNLYNLLTKV